MKSNGARASDGLCRSYGPMDDGLDLAGRGTSLEQTAKLKELGDLVRENKINERLAALKAK